MAWTVKWRVLVDGVDRTAVMDAYLLTIEVTDKDGSASDTASLKFDDTDGRCFLPADGAKVQIDLAGETVFKGTVDEVRSTCAKGQGRELTVSCKGVDSRGAAKQPLSFHKDNATLQEFMTDAARRAGLSSISVDPAFGAIRRTYWAAGGESIMHLGRRLAEELGGSFKIRDDKAVLAQRGTGKAPSGATLPVIRGTWGDNLTSWDIAPFLGRKRFTKARIRYFDRKDGGRWKEEDVEVEGKAGAPAAIDVVRFPKADREQAKATAKGRKADSEREGGEGSVKLNITPSARAEATFILSGARAGVDGAYRIVGVTHRAAKSGGAETSLELKQPSGDAGKDKRRTTPPSGTLAIPSGGLTASSNSAVNATGGTGASVA